MTDLHYREVPVTSAPTEQYKSTAPSWLLGFIAAYFQARNAKMRGLTDTGRYWKAAAISTFGGIALMILSVVALALLVSSVGSTTVSNTSVPVQVPSVSQPAVVPPPASHDTSIADLMLPAESIDDSAETVVMNKEEIRFRAFKTGNTVYLDHYYQFSDSSGYLQSAANINKGSRLTNFEISNVSSSSTPGTGDIVATYDLKADEFATMHIKAHFVFLNGEWRVHDATSS